MNELQQENTKKRYDESSKDLMEALCNSEELDIFASEAVMSMIDYKWFTYGYNSHFYGCICHILYITVLVMFISNTYLFKKEDFPKDKVHTAAPEYMIIMGLLLVYPLLYDGIQMFKQGMAYFNDKWNYIDMLHISLGYLNIYM